MSAWAVPGYTEERELGRGASSRVVAAIHIDSGQQVAIKYLAPKLFRDPNFLARFREEVALLRSLDVPEVVRLYDYVEEPGQGAAIVMELVNGVSLHEMITRQGPTTPESALVVLIGSLLGLASAHELGIVHRDYKPENVLVDGAGNSKLTDFGIAVRAGEKAPASGTPLYMAPEQWTGGLATQATDIYSATAVFYECLTGKTPFSGTLGQLAAQHKTASVPVAMVDQPLRAFIERGMAKDPRDRPAHAVEFVAELISVADYAYGQDWEERGKRHLAERAAALLLLLLGGVAGAAGGSFAATLLGGAARRKKAVFAGAAVGLVAVIAVTTTTLALQSNDTRGATSLTSTSTPVAGAPTVNSPTSGAATTGAPTAGGPTTKSPTASSPAAGGPTASSPATGTATTKPPTSSASATSTPTKSAPATTGPTTNPPTTQAPTTPPPAPVIAVAASPATVSGACPATLPTLTVPGTISSDRAATVTYHWARSDQTSSGSAQVKIPAGGTVSVPDSVTPASNQWEIADTLVVTSPSAHSASTKVAVQCSYSALTLANPGTQFPTVGQSYTLSLKPSGGNGLYSWSVTGALPPGLGFSNGVVSGTPTQTGRYSVTITVTDSEASPQTASATFIIDPLNQIT
ncbi:MAG TPA: protein kinase [Trebonia sp.]|nr:protein kinase [Trebonia sp.]